MQLSEERERALARITQSFPAYMSQNGTRNFQRFSVDHNQCVAKVILARVCARKAETMQPLLDSAMLRRPKGLPARAVVFTCVLLVVTGRVNRITDVNYTVTGPMFTGMRLSLGRSAVLDTGKILFVVCE